MTNGTQPLAMVSFLGGRWVRAFRSRACAGIMAAAMAVAKAAPKATRFMFILVFSLAVPRSSRLRRFSYYD